MRLESELKAVGYKDGTEVFRQTIIDIYTATNRDCTIDNFLCRPWDHREYCGIVRYRLGLNETCDDLILRTLLNLRKRNQCRNGSEHGSTLRIKTELAAQGIGCEPDVFNKTICNVFEDIYKLFSVDQLLMRWRDALHFCDLIRSEFGVPESVAADELILRTLLNNRRKGKLSLRDRGAA